jgi:GDP-L-fucose synthase
VKIALLGSNGFIGSTLRNFLMPDYEVVPVTREVVNLLDSAEVKRFLQLHQFDVIVNGASSFFPDQTLLTDARNNLGIFMNFYNNSDLFGKIINLGSGAEFDIGQPIDSAPESLIFERLPQDSYGFGHNIRSRLCNQKSGFYTLRIFGCFGPGEVAKRLLPRFLASEKEFTLEQDRYFDYISVQDLCTIVKSFVDNDHEISDVNCVYQDKIKLSAFLDQFKTIHAIDKKIHVASTRGNNYTGNSQNLTTLGIKLDGLNPGLKNYFNNIYVSN